MTDDRIIPEAAALRELVALKRLHDKIEAAEATVSTATKEIT